MAKLAKSAAPSTLVAPVHARSLPKGWRIVRFDEIAQNVTERVEPSEANSEIYVGLEHLNPDSLKIRRWGTPSDVIGQKLAFRKGDIIFGKRRAYQRKLAVADFAGICSAHAMVVRAVTAAVEPEFLPFFMQSDMFMERAVDISVGSLSPTINWKTLCIQEFPLPPKDEQRRIADILWAADRVVEQYRDVHAATDSLLDAITADFLSKDWPSIACEDLLVEGPRNGLSPNCNADRQGFPTLAIGAVRSGQIIPEGNLKFAEITDDDLERFRLNRGDVLIVRGNGNRELCGKCGMVDILPADCFYPDLLIKVGFDTSQISPDFAVLQWNSRIVHSRLLQRAKSTNGIYKINGKDIRQHKLSVPPLAKQLRFLSDLAKPRQAVQSTICVLAALQRVKHVLLNDLLTGPCRVH